MYVAVNRHTHVVECNIGNSSSLLVSTSSLLPFTWCKDDIFLRVFVKSHFLFKSLGEHLKNCDIFRNEKSLSNLFKFKGKVSHFSLYRKVDKV